MKVLLAEDIRSNQMLIQAYVEEAGHHVVVVGDGQQAIDAFIKERPDLVILDVIMPIKNGLEVAEEIHKIIDIDHDWVPIIFLSGMIDSADIARGIDAGGDDYLIKPIDATVLNAKLRAMQRIAEMRQQLHQANRKLKMMSVKDGLTGLSNRRHFDETLERELKRAIRTSTAVSLVLCDIDHFKSFNDNYGHQSGDDCLKRVAQALQKTINRSGDLVARYGGEEFVFILPETDVDGAKVLAETARSKIESLAVVHDYSSAAANVTISCGVETIEPQKGQDIAVITRELIEKADQALYQAKNQGRNQVVASAR